MQRRAKIGMAVGVGTCILVAIILIVAITAKEKADNDHAPLDGPWDNVSLSGVKNVEIF